MVITCFLCKWQAHKKPRRSMHRFPSNETERRHWLDVIGKSNTVALGRCAALCSIHFEENCFKYGTVYGMKLLKAGSVPSLHLMKKIDHDYCVDPVLSISGIKQNVVDNVSTKRVDEDMEVEFQQSIKYELMDSAILKEMRRKLEESKKKVLSLKREVRRLRKKNLNMKCSLKEFKNNNNKEKKLLQVRNLYDVR